MNLTEKLEPIILLSSIIIGLASAGTGSNMEILTCIFLCILLYFLFLEIPIKNFKAFKNIKFTLTCIIINFVWVPLFGYFIGNMFLSEDVLMGFFMLIITPCICMHPAFTKTGKSDLILSMFPVNLILLAVFLVIFFSSKGTLNLINLVYTIVTVIIIPFALAQITRVILDETKITETFFKYRILFLAMAIFTVFSSHGLILLDSLNSVLKIFIPLIIFFTTNTIITLLLSQQLNFTYDEYVSLTITTLTRNTPLALAIAFCSFPDSQLVVISLIIASLMELPVLYLVSRFVLLIKKSGLFFTCRIQ